MGKTRAQAEGTQVIGIVAVLATGYVLGTKAGRERYEQIAATARAVAGHPATKSMIDAGRRRIAERVSPDPPIVNLTEIEAQDVPPKRD
jgi:hypothetical protein